jgi:hypothetical protein
MAEAHRQRDDRRVAGLKQREQREGEQGRENRARDVKSLRPIRSDISSKAALLLVIFGIVVDRCCPCVN